MAMPYDPPGAHGESIPTSKPGPGMNALMHYLLGTNPGSTSLGCYDDRSVRGGTSTSLHAVSRAFDWHYSDRKQAEDFMNRFTNGSACLAETIGIQAIHDYHVREGNGQHWGSHPAKGRSWGHGADWHFGSIGPGDLWLHVELTVAAAASADLMKPIGYSAPTHEPTHSPPPADIAGMHADHMAGGSTGHVHPELTLNSPEKDQVREMQRLLIAAGAMKDTPGNRDGIFGPATLRVLQQFQAAHGLKADGRCGPQTWRVLGG
jgi:hypothetical protein